MKSIYISPSNQTTNPYYIKPHNEAEVMERVAVALAAKLLPYEVKAYVRDTRLRTQYRMDEANKLGVDYYISIHSNAGGGKGCETFYQNGLDKPESVKALSRAFALKVNTEIARITTTNTIANDRGLKYRRLDSGRDGNMELRGCAMPACLVEVEFHDTPAGCKWILDNVNNIAEALKRAIVAQMGLVLKPIPAPVPNIYYKSCLPGYTGGSIVDGLKSIGVKYYLGLGAKIAFKNGIIPYIGTSAQNTKMVNLLKAGKLKKV